jgi:hypothetical protein
VLFFVDESWQTVGVHQVGALGAVAIRASGYNPFSREFYRLKRDVLGASELAESEVRGQHAFAKAAFKREELHGDSHWLRTADALFRLLERHHAKVFVIWTTNTAYVSLRSGAHTTALSEPYKQLLFDFRAYLTRTARGRLLGSINFDQRGVREDEAAACTLQNYLVRTGGGWGQHVIQIPNFTVSSVSPGIQAADMMAHLGAHLADEAVRPELAPYIEKMLALQYSWSVGGRRRRSIRRVY